MSSSKLLGTSATGSNIANQESIDLQMPHTPAANPDGMLELSGNGGGSVTKYGSTEDTTIVATTTAAGNSPMDTEEEGAAAVPPASSSCDKNSCGMCEVPVPASSATAEQKKERPIWLQILFVILIVIFGMVEGISFHRSGVTSPNAIFSQMVFKHWVVMKVFLAAIGMSMVAQSILAFTATDKLEASRVWKRKRFGFARVIPGTFILGIGMTTAGSGPTMLPPQVGSNVHWAWAILVGAFVGAVAFAIWEKLMPNLWADPVVDVEKDKITLDKKLGISYSWLALGGGSFLLAAAVVLEFVVNFQEDAAEVGLTPSKNSTAAWPPMIAGIVVGLNQIPLRLIASHGQGGSSAPMMVVSTLTCGKLASNFRLKSFAQAWQFLFVYLGSTFGATCSAFFLPQHEELLPQDTFQIWRTFVGGFLMLFGARIAGGCTCGHGISGVSEFGIESMVGVCCIFAGAIASGFIYQATGLN